jgi:methane/ammonia monooxygenase subunit B
VLAVGTVALVYGGAHWAEKKYPMTLPLQGGKAIIDPLPEAAKSVDLKVVHALYDVPGRSLRMTLQLKNNTDQPLTIGEFTTANLRFVNLANPVATAAVPADYPTDIVSKVGLVVGDNNPLAPGETRRVDLNSTDVIWELERLAALITDPDNRFGGLLFLYDANGNRHISPVYGPIVPHFTDRQVTAATH